jgi:hypothetical protein
VRGPATGNVIVMPERQTSPKRHDAQTRVAAARAALERQRPPGGDLTAETRKLLSEARRREGRFGRRAPVEPMS